jgi:hypothetical protein
LILPVTTEKSYLYIIIQRKHEVVPEVDKLMQ